MTVEELLESRGISYKLSGKDFVIRCLSPDHEDRHPSLRIDKIQGVFNCLSCGFKGNIFTHFGEKPSGLQIRREKVKSLIKDKLQDSIGLNIPENAVPFDREWRGISANTYKKFGAFEHNQAEFLGRLVFPIRSINGKIIAFIGRHMGSGTPKYLNYPSGITLPLFPVVKPINGSIILVEGLFDMLNLYDKGLTNAVCAFGVNQFNQEKLNILKIQGVNTINVFYDNDDAGNKGAEEVKKLLDRNEIAYQRITWGNIKDPGELTAAQVIKLKEKLYGS